MPLLKDKTGNVNDVNNYRAITLIPVISKVLEGVILRLCEDSFVTDYLQFGFKRDIGCTEAIFTLRSVVNDFIDNGSSVYVASLDINKAFDKVNHCKLFNSLLAAGLPLVIIKFLCCWYSKLFVTVRWNTSLSMQFAVCSGVRQGSTLSPALFNLFINAFIVELKSSGIGCHIYDQYFGCLLYAVDFILLSPSVTGLQDMLNICQVTATFLALNFNVMKCHCIAFGKKAALCIDPMSIGSCKIDWYDSIKYLGVHIIAGKRLSFNFDPAKRMFYSACNCVLSQADKTDEILQLTLQETYCLPILMYASPGYYFKKRQLSELNACWNSMYRKIFNFNQWESVKCFINGLGRLDLHHIILLQRLKFFKKLSISSNSLMKDLFWHFCIDNAQLESHFSLIFRSFASINEFLRNDFNSLCISS